MKYKWTILFLVHASNEQTREHVDGLFTILESARYDSHIKLLILYGGLKCSITERFSNQVTLHEIIPSKTSATLSTTHLLSRYGAIDIGDDKKIKKIFAEIRTHYPSERFLLFTWDHGSGFGIFKTDPRERSLLSKEFFLNFEMDIMKGTNLRSLPLEKESIAFEIVTNYAFEEDSNTRDFGDSRGIKKKKIKTSMLTNDELSNIITYNAGTGKVDLLIMMNCAMQLIETGYALKEAVEYLVAPETCIFWAGYDYPSIIAKVSNHPDIETEALGKYVLDTIQSYYNTTPCKEYFNDLVVSLVKPARSEAVKTAIDEIAGSLTNLLPDSLDDFMKIRQNCEDLTGKYVAGVPYHYVDLLHCLAALQQTSGNIAVEQLKLAMQEYVVHIIKGGNYQNDNIENNIGLVNGCTIYYPPTAQDADKDFYYEWFYKSGDQQTLFASRCLWKGFLLHYFRHDRKYKKNIS